MDKVNPVERQTNGFERRQINHTNTQSTFKGLVQDQAS